MSFRPPSHSQELLVPKEDSEDDAAETQPRNDPTYRDSSEEDGPSVTCRRARKDMKEQKIIPPANGHSSSRTHTGRRHRDSSDNSSERPVLRQPTKVSLRSDSKQDQPSSGVRASKSVMKNDLRAKKAVIREIESLWGRGFIKAYIPTCHRPLAKRSDSKRSIFRKHETDPINWLPSVLKAILMVAKLTDDKEWLKQAMNDVVRYRIKHTGNRKPQLVTNDFSVIEDMLVKDWKVPFAFEIRYKHILFQRKDEEVDDEDIDRIMIASSDDGEQDSTHDEVDDLHETDEEDDRVEKDTPTKYRQPNRHTKAQRYALPIPSRRQSKQLDEKNEIAKESNSSSHSASSSRPTDGYNNSAAVPGYGQLLDPWGRPMPAFWGPHVYNGHVDYGAYGGYGSHGPPPRFPGAPQGTQPSAYSLSYYPPPPHSITPTSSVPDPDCNQKRDNHKKRGREFSSVTSKRARHSYTASPDSNIQERLPADTDQSNTIKQEPPADEYWCLNDDWAVPTNELEDDDEEVDEDDLIDAEVEVMELELKLAELKAAQLRARCKRKL